MDLHQVNCKLVFEDSIEEKCIKNYKCQASKGNSMVRWDGLNHKASTQNQHNTPFSINHGQLGWAQSQSLHARPTQHTFHQSIMVSWDGLNHKASTQDQHNTPFIKMKHEAAMQNLLAKAEKLHPGYLF